jgi:hypothetical protein
MTRSLGIVVWVLSACTTTATTTTPPDVTLVDSISDTVVVSDTTQQDIPHETALSACGTCSGEYVARPAPGMVTANSLTEISGIVESRRVSRTFFVHNDSGDQSRFFAINESGQRVAEYNLRNVTAVDWEDIALGPCDQGQCVFIGDIGDNDANRGTYTIYWMEEPAPPRMMPDSIEAEPIAWKSMRFRYPEGSFNAETLLVHRTTGDVYVVTKVAMGASGVYVLRAPFRDGETRMAVRVAELTLPSDAGQLVTGGDLHPCADRLLIRTYLHVYEYTLPSGQPFEQIFSTQPELVTSRIERQGESVGWRVDGRGYVTISEGNNQPLNLYGCE